MIGGVASTALHARGCRIPSAANPKRFIRPPVGSTPVFVLRIGFSRALAVTAELPRHACEFRARVRHRHTSTTVPLDDCSCRSGSAQAATASATTGWGLVSRRSVLSSTGLLDRAGRRRSQGTLSGFHQHRVPRNKGLRYPPDPPPVEEIIAVMRAAGDGPEAMRLRGLIIVLWRAGDRSDRPRERPRPVERSHRRAARRCCCLTPIWVTPTRRSLRSTTGDEAGDDP